MKRNEAFKALRLDPAADAEMVRQAYWTLVRQAQARARTDRTAEAEIDRLNEAYGALAPEDQPMRAHGVEEAIAPPTTGLEFIDRFADWVALEAQRTRRRWAHRNAEIAAIGAAVIVLMVLALGAGASVPLTFLCVGVVFVAIWSPWRRGDDG